MKDYMIHAMTANDEIRAYAITAHDTVEHARVAHETSPVVTAALGRMLMGAGMMGMMMQDDRDLITLQIRGDGPMQGITVTADHLGHVKGFPLVSEVEVPPKYRGKLDVGAAVGHGFLRVMRDTGAPEPYVGTVDLMTGEMKKLTDMDVCLGNAVLTDCAYGAGRSLKKEGGRLYFLTTVRFHTELRSIGAKGDVKIHWDRDGLISDFDVAGETCLVTGQFGMKLNEVYRLAEGDLKPLTDWNKEAFKDVYVAEPVQLSLKSCGYDIDGWVLLPKDYDAAKTYPAVLDVHGGPKCAYGDGFFHEMQMWAGMGCFVFFCNPYGGEGRGNEFAFMRDKYGTTDYQNIMDFTDAVLAAYPQIDPERLCVTGGSYGGFMTNWIVTHTDRFCCGATQRSISNWVSMYGISDIGPVFTEDQCGGGLLDEEGLAKVWAHSPLKYAADCHTPLLFIHSDMDYRCPIAEGYQLYTTLVNKGVTCRMCVFHGETHELSRSGKPKHRIRRLKEITDWFIHYAKIS